MKTFALFCLCIISASAYGQAIESVSSTIGKVTVKITDAPSSRAMMIAVSDDATTKSSTIIYPDAEGKATIELSGLGYIPKNLRVTGYTRDDSNGTGKTVNRFDLGNVNLPDALALMDKDLLAAIIEAAGEQKLTQAQINTCAALLRRGAVILHNKKIESQKLKLEQNVIQ